VSHPKVIWPQSEEVIMRVWWSLVLVCIVFAGLTVLAQSPRGAQNPRQPKPGNVSQRETQPEPPQGEVETLKIDTNLVTVPVIASSRSGTYIADLQKEEFKLADDGVSQEIAFLATINAPFHVVLMLDTSDSTSTKLDQIQRAAIEFLDQLGPNDKVKVISFDGELHDWNDFTSDKNVLRSAIRKTQTGQNTRVYDAVQLALDQLRPIQQRRAIVIFTDGGDWHSESATFDSTLKDLDESGVIVYPIRFDTRADTERIARKQEAEQNGGSLPTSSSILRLPQGGGTPTTFPGDDPSPVPTMRRGSLPIPAPDVIFGRRTTTTGPPRTSPTDPVPDISSRSNRIPPPDQRTVNDPAKPNDTLSATLDMLYLTADSYLKQLADRTGGQLYRADIVATLPQAFAAIAAELRTQYLLGFYPTNKNQDGAYHKLQVKTSRKDVAIRARPGYRARSN